MAKKRRGIILLSLVLLMVFVFFTSCKGGDSALNKDKVSLEDVKIYDDVGVYVKEGIKDAYKTQRVDANDSALPKTYTWTIKTKTEFDELLEGSPFVCDFNTHYCVLYTFTSVELRGYYLSDIKNKDNITILEYSLEKTDGEPRGTAVTPFQRWCIVEVKNPIIENMFLVEKDYIKH